MSETREKEIIEGTVEDIRFRNEQNGYTVLSVGCDDDLITAVGVFSDISVGETVKLQGEWTYHTTFGRQFKVEAFERNMPATTEQLYNYLAAGAIKGIGRATAERIVDMFGEKAFDYLESNPEMLSKVKGISQEKAEKICASYRSQFAIRSITMTLESYGIGPRECLAAYKAFGGDVVGKVTENPYVLCLPEVGVPFDRVETIADNLPHRPNDSYRIKAGVEHILRHNLYVDGHTCIPRDKLLRVAAEFLNTNADTVDIMTDELCHENRLVSKVFTDKEYVFLIQAFRDEKSISDRIKVLLNFPPAGHSALDSEIEKIEKKYGFRKEVDTKIDVSIRNVYNKLSSLNSQNIEIQITNTFYFFPYFIAHFESEKGNYKEAYMNYYIPPRKAMDSIFIKARVNSDEEDNYYYQLNGKNFLKDKTKNIVVDLEAHFDYIWKNQVPPNEKTLLTMFEIML